ncbi:MULTISPECIES: autorepressor SdpR family transcription factor [Priestia]|uniref:autorepressor SdpR family transcription factor n=1 Tax=Priestia TaxID=2800373 RepID=UPI0005EBF75C|nr:MULTISPECIES: autorepressor SdpR family transcription factor [Priestia]KJL04334.1 ArsR family transcriptional regulator [Priestia aryabhattai B8W22]MBE2973534.1 winged helix-turn-helix transcriptional regulator [Priestia megaterium]MBX4162364.1 autorepressor SdpR family transcription factor [Priestia megaterium]MED3897288.1 autorepressor SdpR family transcription factor [Priestia aryabhattai]MED4280966.1 autorepressor SdpR family transcription factor [Priestia megaterium]
MNESFKALADPTRRKILELLKESNLTAGEVSDHFNMTKPSISNHLKILKQGELIQGKKQGQFIIYSLNNNTFQNLISWFTTFERGEK